MAHFEPYTDIPLILDLKNRITIIQNDLKYEVHKIFKNIGQVVDSVADINILIQNATGGLRSLPDVCLVVDALGYDSRKVLVDEFVEMQLQPYDALFGMNKPHFTLEDVSIFVCVDA